MVGYIFIIPLYPKFPIRIIDYTYIAIRMEDFYIGLVLMVFFIQVIRQKIIFQRKFLILFALFWLAIFSSYLFGALVSKTVIYKHLGFLHAIRRIEYMIIFFVAISTSKTRKDFLMFMRYVFTAFFLVGLYGLGQKFLGFPAVQTMNPEFAKGFLLYLTPEARVSSTFAGHYDLAAYLVFFIPIILGFFLGRHHIRYLGLFLLALVILILTASRISYGAYLFSTIAFLIFVKKPKLLVGVLIITAILTFTSSNLTSRFAKTFQIKQLFVNELTGQVVVPEKITAKELPAGSFYFDLDKSKRWGKVTSTDKTDQLLKERLLFDLRDEALKSGKTLTAEEEAMLIATMSAGLRPVNTVVSDISLATRLQVEWPRAIQAFLKNPILGTGPSSITESTDNDYLRWIGEFGLLGAGLFLYILFSLAKFIWFGISTYKPDEKTLYYGFLFGLIGLLFNAAYIDVFEASKVAYTFWLVAGLFVGPLIAKKGNS